MVEIWVMNSDGSSQHPITVPPSGTQDTEPAWSRDGLQIAFTRSYQIWIVKENGTALRPLMDYATLSPFALHHAPSWRPDGAEIAFWRRTGRNVEHRGCVDDCRFDGPGQIPNASESQPLRRLARRSPDGLLVAFWRNDYRQAAIWVVGASGDPYSEHNISNPTTRMV